MHELWLSFLSGCLPCLSASLPLLTLHVSDQLGRNLALAMRQAYPKHDDHTVPTPEREVEHHEHKQQLLLEIHLWAEVLVQFMKHQSYGYPTWVSVSWKRWRSRSKEGSTYHIPIGNSLVGRSACAVAETSNFWVSKLGIMETMCKSDALKKTSYLCVSCCKPFKLGITDSE